MIHRGPRGHPSNASLHSGSIIRHGFRTLCSPTIRKGGSAALDVAKAAQFHAGIDENNGGRNRVDFPPSPRGTASSLQPPAMCTSCNIAVTALRYLLVVVGVRGSDLFKSESNASRPLPFVTPSTVWSGPAEQHVVGCATGRPEKRSESCNGLPVTCSARFGHGSDEPSFSFMKLTHAPGVANVVAHHACVWMPWRLGLWFM